MAKSKKKPNGDKRPTNPANLSQDMSDNHKVPLGLFKEGNQGTK